MQAVLSGRAGVALLLGEGDELSSLHAGRTDEVVLRQEREIPYLFGDATDFDFLEDVNLEEVAEQLGAATAKAEALHLALILLDPQLTPDTRRSAAEDLAELLKIRGVLEHVEGVLYAHPLPAEGDLTGALSCCPGSSEPVRQLLFRLASSQGRIAEAFQSWERIPDRVFGSVEDRANALAIAVKEGLFRDLALTPADGQLESFRAKCLLNERFAALRRHREILREWILPVGEKPRAASRRFPAAPERAKFSVAEDTSSARRQWQIRDRDAEVGWPASALHERRPMRTNGAAPEELCVFNGIDGSTGEYLLPPMTPAEILEVLRRRPVGPEPRGMVPGLDPKSLTASGWGVIFPHGSDPQIREALAPLLAHRRQEAGKKREPRYQEYVYRPGEDVDNFLYRHGVVGGMANPDQMPYYLLIAGGPEEIPYSFQIQLDVQRAVGRICFDTVEEYARYAQTVVRAETAGTARSREVAFFAARNADDPATPLSADYLVTPLAEHLADTDGWQIRTHLAGDATKARLGEMLRGGAPALLFTASHGMGFRLDDPRQPGHQGALLCQDWPGPQAWHGPIPADFYFAADDVGDEARVDGLIAFCFACYGAGTPKHDDFAHRVEGEPKQLAPHDLVAKLPRRLLGHPRGGALAVIGHVDRAWGHSFLGRSLEGQVDVFEHTLRLLLDGWPVGGAMEVFNQRYAELATRLTQALDGERYGRGVDPRELIRLWTAHNDARNYVVVGDPAVRVGS